jgi:GrpB-like predicted nucleotidyltransferase (UPF0157 family)
MTRGLRRGTVALEAYDPRWADEFAKEKIVLEAIFGGAAQAIEHVGSTAVPGLSAKPIIDIEIGLKNFSNWRKFVPQLEAAGYTYMQNRVKPDEVFMPKGPETSRTHYLHLTQFDSQEWLQVLRFRDTLRENESLRREYGRLKQQLAEKFPADREAYSRGKAAFIERVSA